MRSFGISRRGAIIAGSITSLAVAGALVAGPAMAREARHWPTNPSASSTAGNTALQGPLGPMGGRGGRDLGRPGELGDPRAGGPMLHSEGVVAKTTTTNGTTTTTYVTVVQQHGSVTAVTSTTVTVKSLDGYTATWTIPAGNTTTFAVGDEVHADGTKATDGTVTTTVLMKHMAHTAPATGTTIPTPSATA